jgi:PPP family 3-phenylpropionic acid transporter
MSIAVFYLFYFLAAGLLVPYLPPYMKSLGFNGEQISNVSSLGYAGLIFIPPIWGMIADRTRRPAMLLKIASATTAVIFIAMLWARSFAAIALVIGLYSISVAPITTLADTVAVVEARRLGTEYGRLRMWGSFGYIVSAFCFSAYIARYHYIQDVIPVSLAMIFGYAAVSLFNHPPAAESRHHPPSISDAKKLLMRPSFVLFLLAELVHWTALSAYYLLFTIHLDDLGMQRYFGYAAALAVTTEMVTMWTFGSIRRRMPVMAILCVSSLVSSARWLMVSQVTNGPALAGLQSLHAFSFAGCYVGSIAYMEENVPPPLLATGRALFSSLVMGLGGVLGTMLAGRLYDRGHGRLAFFGSGVLELLAPVLLAASWWCARKFAVLSPAVPPEIGDAVMPVPSTDKEPVVAHTRVDN